MKTISSEQIIFFDIDDTLIMWGKIKKGEKAIHVTNPYTGEQHTLRPHPGHIRVLKDRHARGAHIIAWSAGGNKWAEAVIKALKLDEYVQTCMSKPVMYVDDKKAKYILGEHLYLPYESSYGR